METQKNRKLRVLQVVDGFRMGGAEKKLCELVKKMDNSKFESFIANVGPTGPLEENFTNAGAPVFNCQRKHAFDFRPIFKLKKYMIENKIDIVQTTLFWADFVGSIAARLARIPVVISWETVSHEGDPYHNKWQRRNGYKLAMKFNDRIAAVSQEVEDSLIMRRKISPDQIQVIHYGVDLDQYSTNGISKRKDIRSALRIPEGKTVIGIVARLEEVKGHTYFIQAMQRVVEQNDNVAALLIGDGVCRPMLEEQVKSLGLDKFVHFLGKRKDVNDLLKAIDFFVLPSLSEGLPNVILEAMASGKPIIATRVGGVPEAVVQDGNGILVEPQKPDQLKTAILELLNDHEKIEDYGKCSRKLAENEFSLQKQLNDFEEMYRSLYQEKAGDLENRLVK